jgi:hypothetical protein
MSAAPSSDEPGYIVVEQIDINRQEKLYRCSGQRNHGFGKVL